MAVLLSRTMGHLSEECKTVYPLFQKPTKANKPEKSILPSILQTVDGPLGEDATPKINRARGSKNANTLRKNEPKSPPSSHCATLNLTRNEPELLEEVDPNNHRRKRQRIASLREESSAEPENTSSNNSVPQGVQHRQKTSSFRKELATSDVENAAKDPMTPMSETEARKEVDTRNYNSKYIVPTPLEDNMSPPSGASKLRHSTENISTVHNVSDSTDNTRIPPAENRPRKILHLNLKTGTIGSPPAKRALSSTEGTSKLRSSNRGVQRETKVITIRYSPGAWAIGFQIGQILNGTKRIPPSARKKVPSPKKKAPLDPQMRDVSEHDVSERLLTDVANAAPIKAPAPLHPFFSGKPLLKPANAKETLKPGVDTDAVTQAFPKRRRAGSNTCGRPSTPTRSHSSGVVGISGFSCFGASDKILKFPGALEPAWPWKGMVHVRGNETFQQDECQPVKVALVVKSKKSKYQATEISSEEDVISSFAANLSIERVLKSIREINLDEYPQLPDCLRTAQKHFESGYELQRRIRKQLNVRFLPLEKAEDEVQRCDPSRKSAHPALCKEYESIATSLTAFDEFRYETQPWTHKHSPKCSAEVLQTGREAVILKEWLQKLTVMSVETGVSDRTNSRASSVSRRSTTSKTDTSSRRKRKSKKLEGFVVSSDEENNEMDEISEPEDDSTPRGRVLFKKTVIRQGDAAAKGSKDAQRTANAVIISGPHGCGKTAAVYAVAKELGFEVFEINSGSRRSGKDILDKVGDMTRNHLVQRSHDQPQPAPLDEDAQRASDALADDIMSGRQGTMNSFFKPKDVTKPKPKSKTPQSKLKNTKSTQTSLVPKAPPKQQKQSLILFEEVDILYEEDKQFWATIMTLITQSKRPVVMTCQDESAVPLQTLSLHAILRFTPPPVDLAADYMLLVAANEGHALQRDAVKALYQSRNLDLRASLSELNFWCQFAVGDVKGRLDWLHPRWPPGCDVDNHGNTIRVVSEKTYRRGMGWLSQDFLESHMNYLDIEEEILREAWDGWNVDLGHWQNSVNMNGWAAKTRVLSRGKTDDRAYLSMYDDFADTMSSADLCSASAFGVGNQILLDVTSPEMTDRVREDNVLDHPILDASPLLMSDNTGLKIALWMKSRARKYLQVDQHVVHGFEFPSELDRPSEAKIIGLIGNQMSSPEFALTRQDLSLAFDPISEPEKTSGSTNGKLEASVFDRTQAIITTDLAPYVRSIVSYDAKLQQERDRLSNLLSEGGRKGKRMRTTRSAFSALEGGARSTTRKDRYFGAINPYSVLKTGMPSWLEAVPSESIGSEVSITKLSFKNSDLSRMESKDGTDWDEVSS